MQAALPVSRNATGGTGHGLANGVMARRRQQRPIGVLVQDVVPEPILAGFVALGHRVIVVGSVTARVLRWGGVAAADVATAGATAQVEPPAV